MKDLYRRNKLRPRESDRVKIHNCDGSEEDKEAAFTVLLNADKKAKYDRAHATLSNIGYIRRHLGLGGKSNWRLRYGDFLDPAEPAPPRRKKPRKRSPRKPGFAALISWPVVIVALLSLVPLAYFAYVQGGELTLTSEQNVDERMHSLNSDVPVYAGPGMGSPSVEILSAFQALWVDPEQSTGEWAYVKLDNGRVGYVSKNHLAAGSGESAQEAKCQGYGVWRPDSGQHLASGKTGSHILIVENPSAADALVKLKDDEGSTEVFFYVRGGETAAVKTIPAGRFQLQYAVGENYSPACGRFVDDMKTAIEPTSMTFGLGAQGLASASSTRKYLLTGDADKLSAASNRSF